MKLLLRLLILNILFLSSVFADNEKEEVEVFPSANSIGRPATVRMMVGEDGEAGKGEKGFTESHIEENIQTDKNGQVKGGKYKELEKMADDLLKNVVSKEVPQDAGEGKWNPGKDHIPHKYDGGTTEEEIQKNIEEDTQAILNFRTFYGCMDYKVIEPEGCLKIMPKGEMVRTPFVKYHGPPQKIENVDQPLKTGYVTKEEINKILNKLKAEEYYDFAAQISDFENLYAQKLMKYHQCMYTARAEGVDNVDAVNKCKGFIQPYKDPNVTALNKTASEYSKKAIDELKNGTVADKFRFRNYDTPESGFLYNEYHVMPTGLDLRNGFAGLMAFTDMNVIYAFIQLIMIHLQYRDYTPLYDVFVHSGKIPLPVFSDFPTDILVARHSGMSFDYFPEEMFEKALDPLMCQKFNRNSAFSFEDLFSARQTIDEKGFQELEAIDSDRKKTIDNFTSKNTSKNSKTTDAWRGTPKDLTQGLIHFGDYNENIDKLCQGPNQESWLPLLHTVSTNKRIVAASVGTVKGANAGFMTYPFNNYHYTYSNKGGQPELNEDGEVTKSHDGDKVQWLHNAYMNLDKAEEEGADEGGDKVCRSIDRWVKKFGEANVKHYTDKPGDQTLPSQLTEFSGGNWYVAAHWKYWRGCLDPFVEGGTPFPDSEVTRELGEVRD